MTWLSWHEKSERLASEAHVAARRGDLTRARSLFAEAAEAESMALGVADPSKSRTFGITAVSAVSLWLKGERLDEAEKVALKSLSSNVLPAFASDELRLLLQAIWTERAKQEAGVAFVPGQVLVSVRGGEVVTGGAPLDLVVEKVQIVQALFYRTVEVLKGLPHRVRGGVDPSIRELCRPWLFQTVPGSYQFAVAIQEPKQAELFAPRGPNPEEIAGRFLAILRASAEDPEQELMNVVPDEEYRDTFLKLARNLAPTGKSFEEMEIRSAGDPRGIRLSADTRASMNRALGKRESDRGVHTQKQIQPMRGTLRALHLDRDWLELVVDGVSHRIKGLTETVDDVIGPMVNRRVVVQVLRLPKGFRFLDIELDEG